MIAEPKPSSLFKPPAIPFQGSAGSASVSRRCIGGTGTGYGAFASKRCSLPVCGTRLLRRLTDSSERPRKPPTPSRRERGRPMNNTPETSTVAAGIEGKLAYDTNDLTCILPFGARSIWRMWHSQRMPKPSRVGGRVVWPAQVIRDWVAAGMPRCDGIEEGGGR